METVNKLDKKIWGCQNTVECRKIIYFQHAHAQSTSGKTSGKRELPAFVSAARKCNYARLAGAGVHAQASFLLIFALTILIIDYDLYDSLQ